MSLSVEQFWHFCVSSQYDEFATGKTVSRNNRGQSKRTLPADTFLQLPILSLIFWTARSHLPASTQRKGAESRWHFNYIEGLWADSMTSLSPCVSLTFLHLHLLPIPPRPYLCVQQLRPFKKSQRSRGDPISTWALTHTHTYSDRLIQPTFFSS